MITEELFKWASIQDEWELAKMAVRAADRTYIYGPPAVGKSFLAQHLGRKFYNQTLNGDLSVQELMGYYVPTRDGLKWTNGPVITALVEGAVLILNELHKASIQAQDFLLSVLDNNESCNIVLPTGDTVTPGQGFKVIATANEGPECLSDALQSRFEVTTKVTMPNPELVKALNSALPKLGTIVNNSFKDSKRGATLNPRAALAYAKFIKSGMPAKQAALLSFGPVFAQEIDSVLAVSKANKE